MRAIRPKRRTAPSPASLPWSTLNSHAAERHSRYGRSPFRDAADRGTNNLSESGESLGGEPVVADRGDSRFFQDRIRPVYPCGRAVSARRDDRRGGRASRPPRPGKGLEICGYVDERLPARVVGDPSRLRQVLFNLAGNAIKFTERGGLSIVAEPGEEPDEVLISVHDTGIGISAADQARIFLEFEQGESGPARRFGGSGLGLAISKKIVEAMGGAIAVESGAAPGATFLSICRCRAPAIPRSYPLSFPSSPTST